MSEAVKTEDVGPVLTPALRDAIVQLGAAYLQLPQPREPFRGPLDAQAFVLFEAASMNLIDVALKLSGVRS